MTRKEFFQHYLKEIRSIGPVVKGSLAQYNRRCGKPGCRKCQSGEGHPSWILGYYADGRHTTCHVSPSHVGEVKAAIDNYRRLEETLARLGVEYVKMLKGSDC